MRGLGTRREAAQKGGGQDLTKKPSETRGKSKSAEAGRTPAAAKKPKPSPKLDAKPIAKAGSARTAKPPASGPSAKAEKRADESKPRKDAKTKAPAKAPEKPSGKTPAKSGAAPEKGPAPKGAPTKVEAGKPEAAKPSPAKTSPPKPGLGKNASGKGAPAARPKPPTKTEGAEKPGAKPAPAKGAVVKAESKAPDDKPGRKGITVVTPKRARPPRARAAQTLMPAPATLTRLPRHPLIPSGPNAKVRAPLSEADPSAKKKSPFNKAQLEKYRKTLIQKRSDLIAEIAGLEQEALRTSSGSLSHTPSHMAEQGSDTAEQSLSLDLAATERKLIREIDDAVKRVDDGVFGLCELTGRPIPVDRLDELPWTRYSIDAARELERRHYHR